MNSWYLHGPVRVHSPQEWAGTGRPSHPEELTDREQRGVGGEGQDGPGRGEHYAPREAPVPPWRLELTLPRFRRKHFLRA